MRRTFRKRQKPILSLVFSALIILTIPIAIYSLLGSRNFDVRNLAQENQNNDPNCTIYIPYINTKTLGIDKKYQVHVYTSSQGQKFKSVKITEENEGEIFSEQYNPSVEKISKTFFYTPKKLGEQKITGEVQTESETYPCKMDINQEVVFVIASNHPPDFLTDPYFSAKPPSNSITTQESYEYILEITDRDLDQIEYHYSFTPRAHWLHKTILESGKDGNLKIRFAGTPDREGSYLANIFIHDGYNNHLSAQSWVINVGQESSDIPVREAPKLSSVKSEVANAMIFPEPQIAKILPQENSYITNLKSTLSANLIASHKSTIEEDSIVFKLNESNLENQAEIIKISGGEMLLRYIPQGTLEIGEHRVYVCFKDSTGEAVEKEWVFTLDSDLKEGTILGIPISTFAISVTGILLILFALSIPWIIYIAWKKDQPEEYKEVSIIKPKGESSYKKSFEKKS
jgi:hypothetical protein